MVGILVGKARGAARTTVIVTSDLVYAAAFVTGYRRLGKVASALNGIERRYLR